MNDEIWTCRDGRRIPVGKMSEEHVRNVLRMILRKQRQIAEAREELARLAQLAHLHGRELETYLKGCREVWADRDPWPDMPPPGCDEYGSLPD